MALYYRNWKMAVAAMIVVCMGIIRWIFATGWRLRD